MFTNRKNVMKNIQSWNKFAGNTEDNIRGSEIVAYELNKYRKITRKHTILI